MRVIFFREGGLTRPPFGSLFGTLLEGCVGGEKDSFHRHPAFIEITASWADWNPHNLVQTVSGYRRVREDCAGDPPQPGNDLAVFVYQALEGRDGRIVHAVRVEEFFRTVGGSEWARVCVQSHFPPSREDAILYVNEESLLVYDGLRGAFAQHTLGWEMPLDEASYCLVETTMPEDLPWGLPRVVGVLVAPRPPGWSPPERD